MKQILIAATFSLAAASGAYAEPTTTGAAPAAGGVKLSQTDCDALWMKANPSKAEKITEAEAQAYLSDVKAANPDGDGTIEKGEFSNACSQGMIQSSASTGASTGAARQNAPAETSDRSPDKASPTPDEQKDSDKGDTSDRTPAK